MADTYSTPLAQWARVLEIFIPGYMFGKAYGIADEKTVDLFRAQFPAFLINLAEYLKGILQTDNVIDSFLPIEILFDVHVNILYITPS